MPNSFDPKKTTLPKAQQDLWLQLKPAKDLGFVLYGGTAVALYLGHRISIDFDFFCSAPLDKAQLSACAFMADATTIQEDANTFVVLAPSKFGPIAGRQSYAFLRSMASRLMGPPPAVAR